MKNYVRMICFGIWFLSAGCMDQKSSTPVSITSTNTPVPVVSTEVILTPGIAATVIQKYAESAVVTRVASNIEMSVANLRPGENELKIDVCFQTPRGEEWIIYNAKMLAGDEKFPLFEARLLESLRVYRDGVRRLTVFSETAREPEKKDVLLDDSPDYRCDTLRFKLDVESIPSAVDLLVETIGFTPNEGEGCFEYREAVQAILNDKATGILIGCEPGEFQSEYVVAGKPDAMTEEDARKVLSSAKRELFTINGPWVFQGLVPEP